MRRGRGKRARVFVAFEKIVLQVQELLIPLGFPGRGSSAWIDFSQPYSPAVEEAMVRGILSASGIALRIGGKLVAVSSDNILPTKRYLACCWAFRVL